MPLCVSVILTWAGWIFNFLSPTKFLLFRQCSCYNKAGSVDEIKATWAKPVAGWPLLLAWAACLAGVMELYVMLTYLGCELLESWAFERFHLFYQFLAHTLETTQKWVIGLLPSFYWSATLNRSKMGVVSATCLLTSLSSQSQGL